MAIDFQGLGSMGAAAVGAVSGPLEGRAGRRYTERRDALGSINDYRQFIARMLAEDPAKFLKQLAKGSAFATYKKKATSGKEGKTIASQASPERQAIFEAMANPATYNLSQNQAGGFDYKAPAFDPAVSTKYQGNIGGFTAGGQTQNKFGTGASAGFPGGPAAPGPAPPMPQPGFTKDWKRGQGGA